MCQFCLGSYQQKICNRKPLLNKSQLGTAPLNLRIPFNLESILSFVLKQRLSQNKVYLFMETIAPAFKSHYATIVAGGGLHSLWQKVFIWIQKLGLFIRLCQGWWLHKWATHQISPTAVYCSVSHPRIYKEWMSVARQVSRQELLLGSKSAKCIMFGCVCGSKAWKIAQQLLRLPEKTHSRTKRSFKSKQIPSKLENLGGLIEIAKV